MMRRLSRVWPGLWFVAALLASGCGALPVKPTEPEYARSAAQSTASLAGNFEREGRVGRLLDLLEKKAEEAEAMAEEGGPFFTALCRAYGRVLEAGLLREMREASRKGEDVLALLELVLPVLTDHEDLMAGLAEEVGCGAGASLALAAIRRARTELATLKAVEEEKARADMSPGRPEGRESR